MAETTTSEPIRLDTPTGAILGTAMLPPGKGGWPVALIHAGSGPTDRNGNTPALAAPNHSLRFLAEGLAARGIATVRFDKRGIAESAGAATREDDLRLDTYVDDAVGWLRMLRADPRFGRVLLIGHSEGALIGLLASQQEPPDALITVAGMGRPGYVVLREQLAPKLPAELMAASDRIIDGLLEGRTATEVPPLLAPLYRPSVQPYLISFLNRDSVAIAASLSIPMLVIQGTTDIQVTETDARLLAGARPDVKLLIVPGMNHLLKAVPADPAAQLASYADPTLPVMPALLDGIADFVRSLP